MTIEEAIDVLDRNYPDKHFGILCDAVDVAIEVLEKQAVGTYSTSNDADEWYCCFHTCNECGESWMSSYTNYCPNCGVRMENKV